MLYAQKEDYPEYNKPLQFSEEEIKLYHLLMEYRKQNRLPIIPLSYNLSYVAKVHVWDS